MLCEASWRRRRRSLRHTPGLTARAAVPPIRPDVRQRRTAPTRAQAAQERGLHIPSDLAIAGFDGLRSSYIARPRITTVEQPLAEMGQKATEILLQRIENKGLPPEQSTLPVQLLVRESTDGKGVKNEGV